MYTGLMGRAFRKSQAHPGSQSYARTSQNWLNAILVAWTLVCPGLANGAEVPARRLQQPVGVEQLDTRAKIQLELHGQLFTKQASDKKQLSEKTAEIKAKATQDYYERVAFQDDQPVAAGREYLSAQLDNWIAGKATTTRLRPECAQIFVLPQSGIWEQYCPELPLERREVELLRSPVNTQMLEKLLPVEPARTNSQWTVSEEDVRCLLNLEAVHKSNLVAKIASVEKGVIKIDLQGDIQATANSVSTELQILGSAHATLSSRCAMITWLGLSIKENRQVSQTQPGFSVTARIQVIRQEQTIGVQATRNQLLQLAGSDDPARWLVRLESVPSRFAAYVGRDWFIFVDGGEDAVLRMVQDNQVIAQCNIAQLPRLEAGSQLTADGLQADIRQALGERFAEFIEISEKVTSAKLRLLRAEVAGNQEGVPVRWIYAHLSNDGGRRMALVFTLGAEQAEAFAGADLQMLDNLEFLDWPTDPTPPSSETALAAPTDPEKVSSRSSHPSKR
ncbi:MAG: hypothetical protein KF752_04890 [Pirellulaceae bacterium]|nr:hypothetical protein [Pirellulaceae bacterium]